MNGRFVDMSGMKLNKLTVLELSHVGVNSLAYWSCKCECGESVVVSGASLRKGNTKSCGCLRNQKASQRKYVDMTGRRYGMLTALRDVGRTKTGKVLWECLCDCGNIINAPAGDIRQGKYVSCGCRKWAGENNPRWRGGSGRTTGLYPPEWNKKLRNRIRSLDGNTCRYFGCNRPENNRRLDVHHIDGNKNNCEEWNLVSLCNHHHQYVESHGPRELEEYFYSITRNRND